MKDKRRAATTFAVNGLLQAAVATFFTVAGDKAFGAPLFWLATFSFACAWFMERRAAGSRPSEREVDRCRPEEGGAGQ
ncbi:hypothetical protein [Streptomyces vilmorinianum]|uniref:hypothetical protein n=1 Tax=Streptomyces vilmorinianum TaxID=3051092 RepID=UPI0010FB192D|nr:hypothetical protein [Streptomyces vilmorinianum]